MALDDRTAQAQLTPEARRALLRAFADRMLLKITAMDDPEDLPGVERAVRVAAVIERVYSRCDRAERQIRDEAPHLRKAEAECAVHERAAIKARIALAHTLEWEHKRRRDLGPWWDAAQSAAQNHTQASQPFAAPKRPVPVDPTLVNNKTPASLPDTCTAPDTRHVTYVDYTDSLLEAQANLASRQRHTPPPAEPGCARRAKKPPPS